jgi:phosphatidylglycerol:prolipoprotein diacylglycerol transferase
MHPVLFEAGGVTLYAYGVLLAAAYLIGLQVTLVRARARGLDGQRVMDMGIWVIVSALIGAKLLLAVQYPRQYFTSVSGFFELLRVGGVFYGGLIAAIVTAIWCLWRYGLPLWTTGDAIAPALALGHAVGRLGCLLAGCCYGRQTSVPWAITFHDRAAQTIVGTPLGVPLHPTQIYEAGAELLIMCGLLLLERRGRPFAGRTFWTYILLYGVSRFVIEFYRGDDRGMLFGTLSTSQSVSLVLVPLAIVMLFVLSRGTRPAPREAVQARAA